MKTEELNGKQLNIKAALFYLFAKPYLYLYADHDDGMVADKWYGVTYAADKPMVVAALKEKTQEGLYPVGLWK